MKQKNIYIGVDGGASKCKVLIQDENGNFIGDALGGATVIKLSAEKAWHTIVDTVNEALQNTGIDLHDNNYNFHIGLGLTGCEIPEACRKCEALMPSFFSSMRLKSDAYTACLGAHNGKDGSIISIGTGVVSVQILNNKISQVSGFGFPHSDEGGGAWLGVEAIRETFKCEDGRFDNKTSLTKAIMQKFDNNLTNLIVFANSANSTKFAEIAPLVINALQNDDPIAFNLIKKAAKEIDLIGKVLIKKSAHLPCALLGGLAPFVEPYLSSELQSIIIKPQFDAAYGAILMLKKCIK
jgi:glucosamine kinase